MAGQQSLRPFALAAIVAVVVATVWALAAPRAEMPPVSPAGEQPVYAAGDDPALALIEPVLHAPWLDTVTGPARWIVAVLVLLGATGVAIFTGASLLASFFIATALVLDASFGASLTHAGGLVISVGLVWLAAGAAFDEHQRVSVDRPWFNPLSAIVLWSLAVWWDWIAILAWPVVFAALRRTPGRPGRGRWSVASLLIGAGAFVAHFEWMAAEARALSFAPGISLTWREALVVAFDSRPRMPLGSFVSADLTTRLAYLLMALALVGLLFGDLPRWWRRTVLASATLVLAAALGWPAWQAEVFRFGIWAIAPLAAVGLTWVARQNVGGQWVPVVTIVLGAIVLAETVVMGARPPIGPGARMFRDTFTAALDARATGRRMVLVAEDTRLDSALVSWGSTGQRVMRAAPEGDVVAGAMKEGHIVLAGPAARRQLESSGIVFREAFTLTEPAFTMFEATGTLTCATVRTDRWSHLPGLEFTGRLGLALPPQLGAEMQLIVGDALGLQIRAQRADGRDLPLATDALMSGPGRDAPPADYWLDGGLPEDGPRVIKRLHLPAAPARTTLISVRFGRRAPRVLARLVGYDGAARGRVCAAPATSTVLFTGDRHEEQISLEQDESFGLGWFGSEGGEGQSFRWTEADAMLLLSSALRTAATVTLEAEPAAPATLSPTAAGTSPDIATLQLRVNGVDVGTTVMRPGKQRYEWTVPAGTWLAGTNELWWHTSQAVRPADAGGTDTRTLALKVSGVMVTR